MVSTKSKTNFLHRRYFTKLSRMGVYVGLVCVSMVVLLVILFIPHTRPLHVASAQELQQAHHDVILKYFRQATTCSHDNRSKADRIQTFTQYFRVNQYANRAIVRGCNDNDMLYAKMDDGSWQPTEVNIIVTSHQNPVWQKACLIDDITTADDKVHPENSSIDANNLAICDKLHKTPYLHF